MTTPGDKRVLDSLINPLLPLGDEWIEETVSSEEPSEDNVSTAENDSDETILSKALEKQGILLADKGEFFQSVKVLTKAIEADSNRASCYNNRAQAYRLINKTTNALEDLELALKLSHGEGPVAKQAYVQRGLIKKMEFRNQAALADFERASKLGSKFAQILVTEMNPIAALCNNMLKEVYEGLVKESRTNNQVDNEANNHVDNEANNHVDNEANNQVDNEANNHVDNEANNQVDNQANKQVDNEAINQVDNEANSQAAINQANNQANNKDDPCDTSGDNQSDDQDENGDQDDNQNTENQQ